MGDKDTYIPYQGYQGHDTKRSRCHELAAEVRATVVNKSLSKGYDAGEAPGPDLCAAGAVCERLRCKIAEAGVQRCHGG